MAETMRQRLADALHETLHFGTPQGQHDLDIADALLDREPISGLVLVGMLVLRDWPRIRHGASSELYEAVKGLDEEIDLLLSAGDD